MIKSPATLPHFQIRSRFQKGGSYKDLLPPSVLSDICERLTGTNEYTVDFDDSGYNVGRLAILIYEGVTHYISISETNIESRNSSFQSFPSALSRYILDKAERKRISYYIHPDSEGNYQTEYFLFMYRLMKTASVDLLNIDEYVDKAIVGFSAPEDIISAKEKLRSRGKGNNSTYVTTGSEGQIQVYGKTYGANKYETTLICLALVAISPSAIEIYQIEEGGLTSLPVISRQAISAAGNVEIIVSDNKTEAVEFLENNSLRSPKYIYNLFRKFETKRCAFCECEVPQIVQGAHIWPVASIKQCSEFSFEEKLDYALHCDNGLWLCENHHKLFDSGLLYLSSSGDLKFSRDLKPADVDFIGRATTVTKLPATILSAKFVDCLNRRNVGFSEEAFAAFVASDAA